MDSDAVKIAKVIAYTIVTCVIGICLLIAFVVAAYKNIDGIITNGLVAGFTAILTSGVLLKWQEGKSKQS
jgi:hypothetical protein